MLGASRVRFAGLRPPLTRLRAALMERGQQRESGAAANWRNAMEIVLKVDREFVQMCESAGTRPEVVLRCFMWDVLIAGEGQRPQSGGSVMEQLREYAWGYFLRLNFPEQYKA